ncbi:YesL family protein [Planococcus sp. CAU13]|uniref:YesL family protein n=1 Tax=Planococcus sp. CAU13 TaxID=1541197 RepID=UPI00052FECD4|nr:DUF624 domain-containing protein [Planococcus sp. CAU13]
MLELKGISGVFYTMSEWIMRLSGINLLWFVLSLPFFALFVTVEIDSSAGLAFFGIAAWIFSTFLFFPATAAVFSVVRDWVVEEDYSSILKKYFSHLKADYKANIKAGAAFSLIWLAWYYGFFYFYTEKSSGIIFSLLIGAALFIFSVNFLSINSHYHMSGTAKMKNAFFLSAGRPVMGLFIAFCSGVLVWLSVTQLLWLFPLLTCSMTAFLAFSAFYRTARKLEHKTIPDDAG